MKEIDRFAILMMIIVVTLIDIGSIIKLKAERKRNKNQAKKGSDLIFFGLCMLFVSTIFVIVKLII